MDDFCDLIMYRGNTSLIEFTWQHKNWWGVFRSGKKKRLPNGCKPRSFRSALREGGIQKMWPEKTAGWKTMSMADTSDRTISETLMKKFDRESRCKLDGKKAAGWIPASGWAGAPSEAPSAPLWILPPPSSGGWQLCRHLLFFKKLTFQENVQKKHADSRRCFRCKTWQSFWPFPPPGKLSAHSFDRPLAPDKAASHAAWWNPRFIALDL